MTSTTFREVRTANENDTIWKKVSEDDFRRHLVELEQRTNAIPIDVQVFELKNHGTHGLSNQHVLPLSVEQRTADDFAFLAAVQEGAQSVAAVCLEQYLGKNQLLKVRFAAVDTFDEKLKFMLENICKLLMRVNTPAQTSLDDYTEELFRLVMRHHDSRLLARLRSVKWSKPRYLAASHKKPLWRDFANVVHRVQHVYPTKKESVTRRQVEQKLLRLASIYEDFESCEGVEEEQILIRLVRCTYELCQCPCIQAFASRLELLRPTAQIAAALKCLHQLEKIGSYYSISVDLVLTTKQYPVTFSNIQLEYVVPYASISTSIAYESWANTCHVHAEIQLVVDYDLRHQNLKENDGEAVMVWPHVIGTSKYLCYLCYLFIKHHRQYFVANTHGRLYDQWTVPDLKDYGRAVQQRYADVLKKMDEEVRATSDAVGERGQWRAEPMTSRRNLLLQ